jgi:IS5 family transposase
MSGLVELYCSVDDFWKFFKSEWDKHLIDRTWPHGPDPELSTPEMMTIIVLFHQSNFRNFKHFYCDYVLKFFRKEFPKLISYSRFVYLMKNLFVPLFAFLLYSRGKVTGIAFVDSTKIQICHNKRIPRNKVFTGWAKRGKTTAGWFYGFKLHLIINEIGEILALQFTAGNAADISVLEKLSRGIVGKLFGDKGYISAEIAAKLFERGLKLFTTLRNKMKNKLLEIKDKILLRKRVLVETVNDQLKNISQLEHTRHRSVANFFVNALAAIAAYTRQPKKPHINLGKQEAGLVMNF